MQSTPLLPLLPGSLWPQVEAPMGQIDLFYCANKWLMFNWIVSGTSQFMEPFNCVQKNE